MTPRAGFRAARALAVLLVASWFAFAGCSLKGTMKPQSPPDTRIFIEGPVDTVNHIVHLHWFGSQPDGYIAGYDVRLLNPAAPADSAWQFTTRTDSIVTVLTPTGFTQAVFEARAVDDHGVKDPTPAIETFNFNNQPPIVALVGKPNFGDHSDNTFASVTVTWTVTDIDGDASKVLVRVWLDGRANQPDIANGTTFTVPSDRFLVNGDYTSGKRTLYVQGVDDGGMAGPIDSVSWYVRRPVVGARARLLLVDDVPTTDAAKTRVDTLYKNAIANAGVAADQWSVLHLQFNKPWRSATDMTQTFKLFETVVWYRGEQSAFSTVLANYGEGIGPYLDGGGKMFLESANLISTPGSAGALSLDFVNRYMDSDGLFQFPLAPDSSAAWGLSSAGPGVMYVPKLADSLLNRRNVGGLRAFRVRNAADPLIIAPPHTLSQDNPIAMPVAIDVAQSNGGRFIVDTYPMVSATVSVTGFPQRASIVLLKVFGLLGLTGP